ncbi:MAG: aldo/keto reductase [Oscillospiraceae bacterium]|jgi:diketogulonate reductase-like aldo/keto reductase|nr:aldo/keto reductase [Oscillospiraceae bacterium]MBQ5341511.1 aldo/keto reductase [Oscillospiraceae bacterium]MBQ5342439.1 aldo/keto reductase [Oscillospiraceae bacterium]MBR4928535.1 aldo/keto reductase [Oscillospiraceae bacterium]
MLYAKLNNGVEIPMLGLGVFRTPDGEETINSVKWALEAGYRHIDTAKMYENEASVGEGIRQSGLKREEVFVTSKILPADIIAGKTAEGFDQTLEKLGSDYVDMMLLHFPMTDEMNIAAWKTMEEYYKAGKARVIGVSNYSNRQLQVILDMCEIEPAVNQFHIDPNNQDQERLDFCMSKGIYTEAASPFGGTGRTERVLGNPTIMELAEKLGKTPAQVVIRWNLQRGTIMIPKSTHKERIISNFDVFDFELSDEDMAVMASLNDPTAMPFMDPEKAYDMWSGRIPRPFPPRHD